VKFKYFQNRKKGISSIVGGIFFLVLMTSGFTVYYVALDSQAQMLDTQQVIADHEVAKIREKFTISVSADTNDNNRLAIQVTNEGTNVVEIVDAWIVNTTATNQPAIKSEIIYDDAFIPAGFTGDILANTPLYLSLGQYDIKVVSTLGTIVTEKEFDPNNQSEGETVVVLDELFSKPGIFMVIPSPFGWTPTGVKGLWGMNIVNPTDRDMWVNKAVLSLVVTRAEEHDEIFKEGSCSPTGITPPIDVWACTTHNQLKWEPSVGNQHLIPPKSVQQFIVVADEGQLHGNDGVLDTILVTGSVFTTLGQFAKTGYGTAMEQSGMNDFPLVNVYLTRDENNPLNVPDIHTTELGMISGTAKTFYAVLADFEPTNSKFIKNNISRLIINIPPNWTLNSYSSDHFTLTVSSNPDSSTQIVGILDDIIDGEGILAGRTEAGIIEFNVTPPTVLDNTMYVMHVLADGYTDADFLIGPIAEVVLQVCPTGGCS